MISLFTALFAPAAAEGKFDPPTGEVAQATQILAEALKRFDAADANDPNRSAALQESVKKAAGLLAAESPAGERLSTASAADVSKAAREVYEMLSFTPKHEAELPKGAPTYTPVGAIQVKQYPTVRKAVAGGFFTLFSHIKKHNVAMTSPVQMDYSLSDAGRLTQRNMSFFYGSTKMGSTGRDGRVEVVDAEPMTVVAIGIRGRRNDDVMRDRIARLEKWIKSNAEYEKDGSIRVMGYNSPFVRASQQFYEVQIPLTSASPEN